jgi:hypothetical protein
MRNFKGLRFQEPAAERAHLNLDGGFGTCFFPFLSWLSFMRSRMIGNVLSQLRDGLAAGGAVLWRAAAIMFMAPNRHR